MKNEAVPEEPGNMEYTIHSYELKRAKNGRMEQSQAMEYGSRNIYI
jgi:hypothetical protein